jgi:GT2 family glycosyltransferase
MFTHKKSRWYNHVTDRPVAFHFACAISRKNLVELNGFDERYAIGHDYDDAELVVRIQNLGLAIEFVADPWVVHQYHRKTYDNPNNPPVAQNNRELYEQLQQTPQVRADNQESICGI